MHSKHRAAAKPLRAKRERSDAWSCRACLQVGARSALLESVAMGPRWRPTWIGRLRIVQQPLTLRLAVLSIIVSCRDGPPGPSGRAQLDDAFEKSRFPFDSFPAVSRSGQALTAKAIRNDSSIRKYVARERSGVAILLPADQRLRRVHVVVVIVSAH